MGSEADCTLRLGKTRMRGRALLETNEILFRGEQRLVVPFASIHSVRAEGGALHVAWDDRHAVFDIGKPAERWAAAIKNPKSRIEKLGVKPGARIVVLGVDDDTIRAEVEAAGAKISSRSGSGVDLVFFQPGDTNALARIATLKRSIRDDGGIWVLRTKGGTVSERDVLGAGRGAGLVDTKVVAFSATLSAAKFVVPRAKRSPRKR